MARAAIIDYQMGNVRSVRNAVEYCGHDAVVTADPAEIANASHIILPGVGAFGDAVANLSAAGLPAVLNREVREKGKPFLGICLGMQVLARSSTEHAGSEPNPGLGWFAADVVRLEPGDRSLKIPHMGWNALERTREHPILAGIGDRNLNFYYVHSYWMRCDSADDIVAIADYAAPVTAIVARDNIVATQFHPEKSQDSGIELLANFLRWTA